MKKISTFAFALTLILCLSGCSTLSSKEVILSEPPILTVRCNDQIINATSCTAEWNYATVGDEWKGSVSCGVHPLVAKDYAVVMNTSAKEASLEFTVAPDKITVQCWSDAHWGDIEAVSETFTVKDSTLPLKSGGNIYYLTATWNSHEKFNGSADYLFYIIVE